MVKAFPQFLDAAASNDSTFSLPAPGNSNYFLSDHAAAETHALPVSDTQSAHYAQRDALEDNAAYGPAIGSRAWRQQLKQLWQVPALRKPYHGRSNWGAQRQPPHRQRGIDKSSESSQSQPESDATLRGPTRAWSPDSADAAVLQTAPQRELQAALLMPQAGGVTGGAVHACPAALTPLAVSNATILADTSMLSVYLSQSVLQCTLWALHQNKRLVYDVKDGDLPKARAPYYCPCLGWIFCILGSRVHARYDCGLTSF